MLRTYDQSGYYETRLILMAISLGIAGYFAYYKWDRRFLTMFLSGAAVLAVTEYLLQFGGYRGQGFSVAVFGVKLPTLLQPIFQGLAEGGVLGVFAFWFADLRSARAKAKEWLPFGLLGLVVLGMAIAAGVMARTAPLTSARQMFAPITIFMVVSTMFASLWIAWRKDALPGLANFYGGLLVFAALNFATLHVLGARYIGLLSGTRFTHAPAIVQITLSLLSLIFEASGGRLLIFMLPLALGLVALKEKEEPIKRERYSTQHLQDLSQRGWKKRSKPFPK